MGVERLFLKGIRGVCLGEVFRIGYGQKVIVGRGKNCDISYLKFRNYPKDKARRDQNFLAVSRKHLRITFYNSHSMELKDLSTNGTYINGKPIIKRLYIADISTAKIPYEIRLGPNEVFLLAAE